MDLGGYSYIDDNCPEDCLPDCPQAQCGHVYQYSNYVRLMGDSALVCNAIYGPCLVAMVLVTPLVFVKHPVAVVLDLSRPHGTSGWQGDLDENQSLQLNVAHRSEWVWTCDTHRAMIRLSHGKFFLEMLVKA